MLQFFGEIVLTRQKRSGERKSLCLLPIYLWMNIWEQTNYLRICLVLNFVPCKTIANYFTLEVRLNLLPSASGCFLRGWGFEKTVVFACTFLILARILLTMCMTPSKYTKESRLTLNHCFPLFDIKPLFS